MEVEDKLVQLSELIWNEECLFTALGAYIWKLIWLNRIFQLCFTWLCFCRYKSSPEEVAASCDVTFAMLADPQSAVRIFQLYLLDPIAFQLSTVIFTTFQVDVAFGKHGATNGLGPGKGCNVQIQTFFIRFLQLSF